MREIIQLDIIKEILTDYPDDSPLHFFLKDFYKKHRQFGSRDRRFYSDKVYKYLRCKTLFHKLPFEEKLCYSGFLTTPEPDAFYKYVVALSKNDLPFNLSEHWAKPFAEKSEMLVDSAKMSWTNYFPASGSIDTPINKEQFLISHLTQPKFYIRVGQEYIPDTIQKLKENKIEFEQESNCFAFTAQLDMSKYLPENHFEVQDRSSQQTISLFELQSDEAIWDCCSGAGGKSLMLLDKYPDLKIYCSDKRQNILDNLKARFNQKNAKPSGVNIFDVAKNRSGLSFNDTPIPEKFFDIILADVPCSGSGTWGRTPERLYQFKEEEIAIYTAIQNSIIENAIKYLKPGGKLVYITCSVYADENTKNIQSFVKLGLEMQREQYFLGYGEGADSMYGAVLEMNPPAPGLRRTGE